MFRQEFLQGFLLALGQCIHSSWDGSWSAFLEFDGVVPNSRSWESLRFLFAKHLGVSFIFFGEERLLFGLMLFR